MPEAIASCASAPQPVAPDKAALGQAARVLAGGGLVAVPTETVYGLAARADDAAAVARIYTAKGRPSLNPLIVHVADLDAAKRLGRFDARAEMLARHFWPGPLTLVVPLAGDAPLAAAVTAGLASVAIRCPAHPAMRALLRECGLPLAAPSANRSGGVSPTTARHVQQGLGGKLDMILDGGPAEAGIESTIIAMREAGWEVLRPGPVEAAAIARLIGPPTKTGSTKIEAPGQTSSHYSPGKPMRLDADVARSGEFLIGFGPVKGQVSLSPGGDLAEAAARLYACLHEAAAAPEARIAVAPIPAHGLGLALADRLARAAADQYSAGTCGSNSSISA